ncbi:MAG: MerR family transcriptional regulator [Chthonomonadaceae bacterium]|nr:MerR family transcriptional regulator [Chthonomonadaceae bacterium]
MPKEFRLVHHRARPAYAGESLLDTADLAQAVGLHPELVQRLYSLGALEAVVDSRSQPLFSPVTALRLRRIVRLRQDLGISWRDLGLVADLLERIGALDAQIRELEARLVQDPAREGLKPVREAGEERR